MRGNDNYEDMWLLGFVNCLGNFYEREWQGQFGQIPTVGTLRKPVY